MSERQDPKEIARELCGVFGIGMLDRYRGTLEFAIVSAIQSERDAAEAREKASCETLARFMMSFGSSTGHGDSIEDLLREFGGFLDEKRSREKVLRDALKPFATAWERYSDALKSQEYGELKLPGSYPEMQDFRNAVLALSSTPKPESGWQPIESAPKEKKAMLRPHVMHGTMSVIFIPEGFTPIGYEEKWHWMSSGYTHGWPDDAFLPYWMEIPAPPVDTPKPEASEASS